MPTDVSLPDEFLSGLVAELDDVNTVAIALTGSHARGEATPYSDVDLIQFARTLPQKETERYTLQYRDGHLVSISTTTIAAKRDEMARPQEALWVVPALRQARILLDKDGSLGQLQTVNLLRHILRPKHLWVIDNTLTAIRGSGFALPK